MQVLRALSPVLTLVAVFGLGACHRLPPKHPFPSAGSALERLAEEKACSHGLKGEGTLDVYQGIFGATVEVLYLAAAPDRVRIDAFTPLGAILATLTSNGQTFELYDAREQAYVRGEASACNLARFTGAPIPAHALVDLLSGRAPLLVHEPSDASISWEDGYYVIHVQSRHQATERIYLEPVEEDWDKPWQEQRVRVRRVVVSQAGHVLYDAELSDYQRVASAKPPPDPDGLASDTPGSEPVCAAEVPTELTFDSPAGNDLELHVHTAVHNPKLSPGVFQQIIPEGSAVGSVSCAD